MVSSGGSDTSYPSNLRSHFMDDETDEEHPRMSEMATKSWKFLILYDSGRLDWL